MIILNLKSIYFQVFYILYLEEMKAEKVQEKNDELQLNDQCGERAEYHNLVDILFVLDATGSMGWCMNEMKKTVRKVMKKFADNQYNIKFAIELYRDHQPQEFTYVEKHFDLRNLEETIKIIDEECEVAGGGDTPQAVFDGLVNGLKKTSWRIGKDGMTKSKRFLFHGCDAPPHGKQYGCSSSSSQWTEKGCPCGLTRHDVKKLLDEHCVDYSIIKVGTQADTMSALFKECFQDKFKQQLQIQPKMKDQLFGSMTSKVAQYLPPPPKMASYLPPPPPPPKMASYLASQRCEISSCFAMPQKCTTSTTYSAPTQNKRASTFNSLFGLVDKKMALKPAAQLCYSESKKMWEPQKAEKKNWAQMQDSDSEDEKKGGLSMASLVCKGVESGVKSYFKTSEKKPEKKEEKK